MVGRALGTARSSSAERKRTRLRVEKMIQKRESFLLFPRFVAGATEDAGRVGTLRSLGLGGSAGLCRCCCVSDDMMVSRCSVRAG